jgi:hypothetical protein
MHLPGVEQARLLTLLVHAEPLTDAHRVLQVLYPLHFVLAYVGNFPSPISLEINSTSRGARLPFVEASIQERLSSCWINHSTDEILQSF